MEQFWYFIKSPFATKFFKTTGGGGGESNKNIRHINFTFEVIFYLYKLSIMKNIEN